MYSHITAAAKEGGGDTDEMEAEAAALIADDDPTGVLGSLIVEHANLMERFKMSGWNLEKLRQKARDLGYSDEQIAAAEAAGEKVVAHCTHGMGRSGRVSAAWLAVRYGLSPEEHLGALKTH